MSGNGLQLASDLVLYLGRHSYFDAPFCFGNQSRSRLDTAMDALLCNQANAIKGNSQTLDHNKRLML